MRTSTNGSSSLLWSVTCTALLAAAATAQPYWTVTDTGNGDGVIDPAAGERAVLTLWSSCHMGYGFAQSLYDITGDAAWQGNGFIVASVNLVDNLQMGPGTPGVGNSITGIDSNQLPALFNPNFIADNPIAIYQIEWEPQASGSYSATVTSNHTTHMWYSDSFGTAFSCSPGAATGTFQMIPAPGALALVGVTCMGAAARRRR